MQLPYGSAAIAVVFTADSANLSITDNLDIRVRLSMDDWTPTGSNRADVRCETAGRRRVDAFVPTSPPDGRCLSGGIPAASTSETASADSALLRRGLHRIRVSAFGYVGEFLDFATTTPTTTRQLPGPRSGRLRPRRRGRSRSTVVDLRHHRRRQVPGALPARRVSAGPLPFGTM